MALVIRKPIDDNDTSLQKRPKVGKRKDKRSEFGRLYVIKLVLKDGTEVHKIGIVDVDDDCATYDKLVELTTAIYRKYNYTPQVTLLKVVKVRIPEIVDSFIHRLLKGLEYQI